MRIAASIAFAAGVLACFAPAARAQSEDASADPGWTVGAELDLNSRYLWRSLVWNDKRVAQPSL